MKYITIDKDYSLDKEYKMILKFLSMLDESHPTQLAEITLNETELCDQSFYNALGEYAARSQMANSDLDDYC